MGVDEHHMPFERLAQAIPPAYAQLWCFRKRAWSDAVTASAIWGAGDHVRRNAPRSDPLQEDDGFLAAGGWEREPRRRTG
eukprot:5862158-Prymnesium_polylepis.1